MKHLFYLFAVVLALASCNNPDGNNEGNIPIDSSIQQKDSSPTPSKQHAKKKADSTYYYEPSMSILTGTLMEDEFFGAPGYGATPDKDAKEKQWILYLDNPINVKPAKDSDKGLDAKNKIDKITLIVDKKSSKFKNNIGKTIKVKGKLFPAETGHHHTAVLLGDAEMVK